MTLKPNTQAMHMIQVRLDTLADIDLPYGNNNSHYSYLSKLNRDICGKCCCFGKYFCVKVFPTVQQDI